MWTAHRQLAAFGRQIINDILPCGESVDIFGKRHHALGSGGGKQADFENFLAV